MSASASCGHAVANAYDRVVPIPDLSRCSKQREPMRLFNDFVCAAEHRGRQLKAKHPRGLEIDD